VSFRIHPVDLKTSGQEAFEIASIHFFLKKIDQRNAVLKKA